MIQGHDSPPALSSRPRPPRSSRYTSSTIHALISAEHVLVGEDTADEGVVLGVTVDEGLVEGGLGDALVTAEPYLALRL